MNVFDENVYLKWINIVVHIGNFLSNRKALWLLLCRVAIFDRYELICALVIGSSISYIKTRILKLHFIHYTQKL